MQDPFNIQKNIIVNWSQSKKERISQLKSERLNNRTLDERFIYISNIKKVVTEEQLREAFKQFGEINSIKVGSPQASHYNTNYATIYYTDVNNAKQLIQDFKSKAPAFKDPLIASLFEREPYIGNLLPRNQL